MGVEFCWPIAGTPRAGSIAGVLVSATSSTDVVEPAIEPFGQALVRLVAAAETLPNRESCMVRQGSRPLKLFLIFIPLDFDILKAWMIVRSSHGGMFLDLSEDCFHAHRKF